MTTRILIPSGVLGLGFDEEALWRGVDMSPDLIAIDGGSTDSGPASLGSGTSKYARGAIKAEWRVLMQARAKAGVPLVIGTCGTAGADPHVDWMYQITLELAAELGQSLRIARLYSEQSPQSLRTAFDAGKVTALDPAPDLDADKIDGMCHIVALAGAEQIQKALDTGADIVLAGRTTDTAIIAALPLARGEHPGACWHGAKVGECGALCSTNPTSGVIVVDFDDTGFEVTPLAKGARCTPHSVCAHMLYENSDPYILYEPGGYLDVTHAGYSALNDTSVRVTGAQWHPGAYTVKLEAARVAGYQTTLMATLRNRRYVENARAWADRLLAFLDRKIAAGMDLPKDAYTVDLRLIGIDSALGALEAHQGAPTEVGAFVIVTAPTQQDATEIAKLINPFLLHYPLTDDEELPTFAFPYSPAHSERGALYEFAMNHVLTLDDPMQAFRLVTEDI
ncbi:acyclic terpene utilization AtuA family protein [Tropicibacter oceani]|uniref:Acyclic terpene utilization AtuA family protein n=1 Tax=Tropicibacter oceani TaxID=3058420 RepID=A0ABY8QHZ1_9RHOB|nr:acyclic terpene utilization AtuA family protein [Tropicibacter oceani]WGW03606.1 acyclic terpene utilization AtuA family protein [Tropicibacter oceani]